MSQSQSEVWHFCGSDSLALTDRDNPNVERFIFNAWKWSSLKLLWQADSSCAARGVWRRTSGRDAAASKHLGKLPFSQGFTEHMGGIETNRYTFMR